VFTLAGHNITTARAYLPAWGAWYADVQTDGEHDLAGAVDLVLADLTLRGTVLSGGASKGRSEFRIVGGKGRWGKTIPDTSYANSAGVKLSTVLGDAAAACGETLDTSTIDRAARVGPSWARREDRACRLLEQLVPRAWYVGEDGITRLGRRPAVVYTDAAPRVTPLDRARRRVTLAPATLAKLVPGAIVDGLEAIDVVHEASAKGGVRTTIYGADGLASGSQVIDAFREILDQLDPDRAFRAVWEYRVVTQDGELLNLQPVLVSSGMPVERATSSRRCG